MTQALTVSVETPNDVVSLIVDPDAEQTVRIQATDLADAQNQRARLRQDVTDAGHDPDRLSVVLDVDLHIAADARTARKDLAGSVSVPAPRSLLYVGTASGLAGLISDIKAADVADGVALHPMLDRGEVVQRIVDEVLPILAARYAVAS